MTATPTAVLVLALFAPPSCGPVATHAGRWDCVKSGFIFPILFWRRPTVRTALTCHPERRGCLARAPRSQAEHGAAWRWLVLDRRRRMGEGSAQGCPGVKAAREAGPTAGLTAV